MDIDTIDSKIRYQPRVCRLCLALTTTYFSLVEDTRTAGMLEALTSLRILPSDDISTVTCLKCLLNLKLAFSIQQNMLKAEQRFRQHFFSVPIKQERDLENVEPEEHKFDMDVTHLMKVDQDSAPEEYICDFCGKKWSSRSDLSRHKKNVHMQVTCPICAKTIKKGNIKAHMDNKHATTGEIHACDICGIEKSSKVALYKHKHWVHKLKKCHICNKEFTSILLKKHLATHSPPREPPMKVELQDPEITLQRERHICDLCGVEKSTKATLTRHRHSVHKLSKCNICEKVVKSESLRKHLKTHDTLPIKTIKVENVDCDDALNMNPEDEFSCEICGKTKTSLKALNRHKSSVHVEGECPICKKKMAQVNLKPHIERHSKLFAVCELCGVSVVKQDLRRHMFNVHTVRKLKCAFCDKIFRKHYSRTLHERREHLNEGNYTCDRCGKRFYNPRRLRKHIEGIHLKLRPHVCEFCSVGFSSKFALQTHKRQHTNERPYKCDFCGEGFRQKVSLKSHLKSQHDVEEELNFVCDVCGKSFASTIALKTHQRIH